MRFSVAASRASTDAVHGGGRRLRSLALLQRQLRRRRRLLLRLLLEPLDAHVDRQDDLHNVHQLLLGGAALLGRRRQTVC